jgi:chromosome partitioning protein
VVDAFGDDVFHTVISRTIKFPDATVAGEPITSFAPSHPAADAYRQLARELMTR